MAKKRYQFRFDQETIDMLDTLIPFLSSIDNIKLDRTKVLEKLVSERYERLLNKDLLLISDVLNDSESK